MFRPISLISHGLVLLAAYAWTDSVGGFLLTGGGIVLLVDRYALRLLPWPPVEWRRELRRFGVSFVVGTTGFYLMRPGIVPIWEACYRGLMVCLAVALAEQALRLGRRLGCPTSILQAGLLGLLLMIVPVVIGLHPLHTVPKRTPAAFGFAFDDIRFRAADGVQLAAWVVPHSAARGNVIFCHGHGRNRGHVAGCLQSLHDMGLNVLAFDFRGHGDSDGHTSTFGRREVLDLQAAVAYMNARFPDQPLVLVGVSLGAAVSLQALPELPMVRGLWSEGAFAHLTSAVNQEFAALPATVREPFVYCCYLLGWLDTGVWAPSVNPIDHLRAVNVPIFFCHGTADELAPHADGVALNEAYAGPKSHWWVEGASHYHVRQRDREAYLGRLRAFLEECITNTPGKSVRCGGHIGRRAERSVRRRVGPTHTRFTSGTGARRSGSTSGRWSPPTRPASVGGEVALDNLGRASALLGEPRKATG